MAAALRTKAKVKKGPLLTPLDLFFSNLPRRPNFDMVGRPAGPSPSTAWLQSIDATYTIFESEKYREKYGRLSDQVRRAVELCEEVVREFG